MDKLINTLRSTANTGFTLGRVDINNRVKDITNELRRLDMIDRGKLFESVQLSPLLIKAVEGLHCARTVVELIGKLGTTCHNLVMFLQFDSTANSSLLRTRMKTHAEGMVHYYKLASVRERAIMHIQTDLMPDHMSACIDRDTVGPTHARSTVEMLEYIDSIEIGDGTWGHFKSLKVKKISEVAGVEAFSRLRDCDPTTMATDIAEVQYAVMKECTELATNRTKLRSMLVLNAEGGQRIARRYSFFEELSIADPDCVAEDAAMHYEIYNAENAVLVIDKGVKKSTVAEVIDNLPPNAKVLLLDRKHLDAFRAVDDRFRVRVCNRKQPYVMDNAIMELMRK